jgi:hypothetical protein
MSEHVYFTQALMLRYTLRNSLAGRSVLLFVAAETRKMAQACVHR